MPVDTDRVLRFRPAGSAQYSGGVDTGDSATDLRAWRMPSSPGLGLPLLAMCRSGLDRRTRTGHPRPSWCSQRQRVCGVTRQNAFAVYRDVVPQRGHTGACAPERSSSSESPTLGSDAATDGDRRQSHQACRGRPEEPGADDRYGSGRERTSGWPNQRRPRQPPVVPHGAVDGLLEAEWSGPASVVRRVPASDR